MLVEAGLAGEALPAPEADLGSLSSVAQLVPPQVPEGTVALPTLGADEGALAGADEPVPGEVGLLAEDLAALRARAELFLGVDPLVHEEGETPSAVQAGKQRVPTCVLGAGTCRQSAWGSGHAGAGALVGEDVGSLCKALAACGAWVWPLARVRLLVLGQLGPLEEALGAAATRPGVCAGAR